MSPESLTLVTLAAVGLAVGSFLNVCIYRLPRGESLVSPGSRCPECGTPIKAYDNVPVLGYIFLGGKCRSCKAAISVRYPLVEALNALMYVLVFLRFGMGWHMPVFLAFVSSIIVITLIDVDVQIIPDVITIPWVPIGVLAGALVLPDVFWRYEPLGLVTSLTGAVSGFALFYLIVVLSRGGMGGGDVKMMAMVGAVLGWKGVLLTTFVGSLSGAFVGLGLVLFKGGGRKTKVPFGPFLALGALVSLFYGQEILRWYLHG